MRTILLLALCAGCGGGPALGGIPRANPAIVAGAAAAVAGAITLADPGAAARQQESTQTVAEKREIKSHETVPRDVFDRLDAQPATPMVRAPVSRPRPVGAPQPLPASLMVPAP